MEVKTNRLYRRTEVEEFSTLSRCTIYNQMAEGLFPKPVKIGKGAVAWRGADLLEWMNTREVSE